MSKRTPGLPQRPRGFWPTPIEAVKPLIPHLPARAVYIEPCAGAGDLIWHLAALWKGGEIAHAFDLVPQDEGIDVGDALALDLRPDLYITNPPWPKIGQRGDPALSIIKHLSALAPTWMLLPWDFAANDYFREVWPQCDRVVPIGRVSWLGNGQGGKDNAAWFRFGPWPSAPTLLYARGGL